MNPKIRTAIGAIVVLLTVLWGVSMVQIHTEYKTPAVQAQQAIMGCDPKDWHDYAAAAISGYTVNSGLQSYETIATLAAKTADAMCYEEIKRH